MGVICDIAKHSNHMTLCACRDALMQGVAPQAPGESTYIGYIQIS